MPCLPPFGSIRPCDAGIGGVKHVLVDVVAYVDFHGTARSLVFPWCDGFGDAYFRVVVPVIAEGAEEERLVHRVVEFRFTPGFLGFDVLFAGIRVDAPFPGDVAAPLICIRHERAVEIGVGGYQRPACP